MKMITRLDSLRTQLAMKHLLIADLLTHKDAIYAEIDRQMATVEKLKLEIVEEQMTETAEREVRRLGMLEIV